MQNSILALFGDRFELDNKRDDIIFTPCETAQDMVNKIPEEEYKPNSSFLDFCCRSGVFLKLVHDKLMQAPLMIKFENNPYKRHKYIVDKQLYGIAPTENCRVLATRMVCGDLESKYNIITLNNKYKEHKEELRISDKKGETEYERYLLIVRNEDRRFLHEVLREEFNKVKFNVVITNPPYNKGMDIDFIELAYKMSLDYAVAITPAKWQTSEADQKIQSKLTYGQFRDKLVPHMKHVTFYPCCKDVFDIYQTDGITWYMMDKNTHNKCTVENICKDIKIFNSTEERSILNSESLLNIGNEIINSLGNYNRFKFQEISGHKRYEIWMNTKVSGYDWYATKSPRYVLSVSRCLDKQANQKYDGEAKCIFESDSLDECKSFISWIYSKFVRFFLVPNISKLNNIQTNHCFRFVPEPTVLNEDGSRVTGKFDHIYTDEELYKTFNLPQKYIDIIEAVIKERK